MMVVKAEGGKGKQDSSGGATAFIVCDGAQNKMQKSESSARRTDRSFHRQGVASQDG